MRKIREILRLRAAGKSQHLIALSVGIGQSTVGDCLTRARLAGVSWPTLLDDEALERALYPPRPAVPSAERGEPDWAEVHRELKRKGVTLFLLWEEYKSTHPNGFQYSWFCQRYRAYAGKLDLVMRQTHRAGETMFVDYAGQTVPVVNRDTGELREAQIFVAALGASSYTFARASWTQSLPDWIDAHCRAFTFFGGVTETLVPDNLKAGVTHPHRYEPELNPTYPDMATHYGVVVLPTRVANCSSTASPPNVPTNAFSIDYATLAFDNKPASKTSTIATAAASTNVSSDNSPTVTISTATSMSSSPAPLALAKRGSPAHSLTKPAVMASTPATLDCLVSSRNSPSPRHTGVTPNSCVNTLNPTSSSSMTGVSSTSTMTLDATSSKYSTTGTTVNLLSSPVSYRPTNGMTTSDEPTLADAILDRLVHNAYKINLKGESMRKNNPDLTTDTTNK